MTRYTTWAVFGVDADSPEHAKEIVGYLIDPEWSTAQQIGLSEKCRVNTTVLVSPELDKVLDKIEEAT